MRYLFTTTNKKQTNYKKIEEVIGLGYRVCIWNDKRISQFKDINDMIRSGLSENEVKDIIDKCTVQVSQVSYS